MTLRQLCNLTYTDLVQGRDRAGRAELDTLLAPPEEKEKVVARANQEAMRQLSNFGLKPPVRR